MRSLRTVNECCKHKFVVDQLLFHGATVLVIQILIDKLAWLHWYHWHHWHHFFLIHFKKETDILLYIFSWLCISIFSFR